MGLVVMQSYRKSVIFVYLVQVFVLLFVMEKSVSLFLAVTVAAFAFLSCSDKGGTLVECIFEEGSPEKVQILSSDLGIDTLIAVQGGRFSFRFPDDGAVTTGTFSFNDDSVIESFILDGSRLSYTYSGDSLSLVSSGGSGLNPRMKEYDSLQSEIYRKVLKDPDAYDEYVELNRRMFDENKDNFMGVRAFMILSQFEDDEGQERLISQLSPAVQRSPRIMKRLKDISKRRATAEGAMFLDIEVPQRDGSVRRLSDYVGKGKYILVDFWASWCGPCIAELPYLKAAFEKYRGETFDIVGVAVSDEYEDSEKAVSEHGIPWNQILGGGSIPSSVYGFNSIPQAYLFAPDGTILRKTGLRGEQLDLTLSEFLR